MRKLDYPRNISEIIDRIYSNGFEAYIVGGSVRNMIIGIPPKDFDICTNALPEEIIRIFETEYKVIPTGLKHGTVTVVDNSEHIEITTYRVDKEYIDGRRPDGVEFVSDLKLDLGRRDFTINAMAFNTIEGLKDYYNGLEDIEKGLIRTVGKAEERFCEDYLRMMRCIRFSCQLGFDIEEDTYRAIGNNHEGIIKISMERIRDELDKILTSDNPTYGLRLMLDTGILKLIIPELTNCVGFEQHNPHHTKDVFGHILDVVERTENNLVLRLAALLHDVGKPETFEMDDEGIGHFYGHHIASQRIAIDVLTRLRYSNNIIDQVSSLVKEHMIDHSDYTDKALKRLIKRIGNDNIDNLFNLLRADKKNTHDREAIDTIALRCDEIIEREEPISIKDLEVNGKDIIALGVKPGTVIGKILNELLDIVLDKPEMNNKDKLIDECRKMLMDK